MTPGACQASGAMTRRQTSSGSPAYRLAQSIRKLSGSRRRRRLKAEIAATPDLVCQALFQAHTPEQPLEFFALTVPEADGETASGPGQDRPHIVCSSRIRLKIVHLFDTWGQRRVGKQPPVLPDGPQRCTAPWQVVPPPLLVLPHPVGIWHLKPGEFWRLEGTEAEG